MCPPFLVSRSVHAGTGAACGANAPSPDATVTPGELVIEPATLINLGFEWFIQGDANRNARVAVSFRKQGDTAWRQALPLLRLQGERVYAESRVDVIAPNMFAGSVLDLEPDTAYEVAARADRSGRCAGRQRERIVTVRTRAGTDCPMTGGRMFHVYPHGFKGRRSSPRSKG